MANARLIFPRVGVDWGGKNLTSYTGESFVSEPMVYDVSVEMSMENNTPTGSMKWNPSGSGFAVYQKLLEKSINDIITVKFYYEGAKKITFEFVWAGHQEVYGNENTVTIKLRSQLDGLINTDIRNTTQVYDEDKGVSYQAVLDKYKKQYGIKDNLVKTSQKAAKDLNKAKLENAYRESETYGSAVANLVKQNGNFVFANNIKKANMAVFTPFSWKPEEGDVTEPGVSETDFDPSKRYGYLLGPSIINTLERTLEWTPPQQNTNTSALKQPLPTTNKPQPGVKDKQKNQKTGQEQLEKKGAVSGPKNAEPNRGVRNTENEDGPTKQILLQKEGQSKLSTQVFACPAIMGIKPCDIVYVPSLKSGVPYIEDWIVETISYQQTNGGIDISIGATRIFTQEGLMNPAAGKKFKEKASSLNKEGRAGIDAWQEYAWKLPWSKGSNPTPAPAPADDGIPGFKSARGGRFVDM